MQDAQHSWHAIAPLHWCAAASLALHAEPCVPCLSRAVCCNLRGMLHG
jgi:hypothetical protein